MNTSAKFLMEDKARQELACRGCKGHKAAGLVVCWECWQEYKYFDGNIEQFSQRKGVQHG